MGSKCVKQPRVGGLAVSRSSTPARDAGVRPRRSHDAQPWKNPYDADSVNAQAWDRGLEAAARKVDKKTSLTRKLEKWHRMSWDLEEDARVVREGGHARLADGLQSVSSALGALFRDAVGR